MMMTKTHDKNWIFNKRIDYYTIFADDDYADSSFRSIYHV